MSVFNNFSTNFRYATIVEKIIYINVALFIVSLFAGNFVVQWFSLKGDFDYFITQFWTIITYGFFHANFPHVLFNLIFLFYIGNLFLDFFSKKQFINYYFWGIIAGGIAYLATQTGGYLVGASAGIMAVLVGLATKIPYYEVRLALIGGVKMWIIALVYIGISIIGLEGTNAGGNFAHLGGALIGFVYTKQLERGNDIGKWIESIFNFFANLFKRNKAPKTPFQKVYKNKRSSQKTTKESTPDQQQKIDAILDKISKSGYASLSKEEKDFLFKQGKQ